MLAVHKTYTKNQGVTFWSVICVSFCPKLLKDTDMNMQTKIMLKSLITLLSVFALSANAVVIEVMPSSTDWGSGDGNSAITDTVARSGNGSLELDGDRTRFFGLGNPFDPSSNIGKLSDLSDFSFEWLIAGSSLSDLGADYTPALRLHLWDGSQRSELIWEGAYNGTYGNTSRDTWYSSDFTDNFWQFQSGVGVTAIYDRGLDDWKGLYSADAYISSISIGVGSSVGNNYKAFADNVSLQFTGNESRTFNFETAASVVSAPATATMLGLSLLTLLIRTKRKAKA